MSVPTPAVATNAAAQRTSQAEAARRCAEQWLHAADKATERARELLADAEPAADEWAWAAIVNMRFESSREVDLASCGITGAMRHLFAAMPGEARS